MEKEESVRMKKAPKIKRMREAVVERLAKGKGKVIDGAVSVVKELVENSLDASSTSIKVIVKDGGYRLIQVTDNGHGIRFKDLPILCEKHTTSKLVAFQDLPSIKSLGFRGEALASMTSAAHVTVTTITQGDSIAHRVSYRDGVMEHEPTACAAMQGTQIMVENLFLDMHEKRNTPKCYSKEYCKIVDLVRRFAVHYNNVSFYCKKHGANKVEVHTMVTSSRLDVIRSIYGDSVARNLIKIEALDYDPSDTHFEIHGYMSNALCTAKETTVLLFINDRLVDWPRLKRAIGLIYAEKVSKASKPFIYISLVLPPENINVSVQPTKKEVNLFNDEVIRAKILMAIESTLRNSNEAHIFKEQTPGQSSLSHVNTGKVKVSPTPTSSKAQEVPVHKLVRTDLVDTTRRLCAHMQILPNEHVEKNGSLNIVRSSIRQRMNPKDSELLASVEELLAEIRNKCDDGIKDIIRHCTFVKMTDVDFALIQHNTCFYLANVVNISKELIYQQVLSRFAHFNAIHLSDPLPLKELIILALKEKDLDSECNDDDFNEEIAEMNTECLKQKAEMLKEYFGIHIDDHGNICQLPVILDQYTPDMDRIPEFVLSLCNNVDWEDEKSCFRGVSAALGNFYAMHPPKLLDPSHEGLPLHKKRKLVDSCAKKNMCDGTGSDVYNKVEDKLRLTQRGLSIQHMLFPSMRLFKPPVSMAGTFIQEASSEKH